jgi:transposase
VSGGDRRKGEDKNLSEKKYLLYWNRMHKDMHCAVIIDCWMNKLGEVSFENRPSKFPAFVEDVRRICGTKEFMFGLEDTRGFGRNLAAYLIGRRFEVKHVNPAYTSAVRLSNPIIHKDDSYDAYCVARVLRDMADTLQDARHEDIFWTIRQLVKRRDLIVKSNVMNKNQLHSQLSYSYPSYRKFFALIDAKSALCFWEHYPSLEHVKATTPEKIYETIKPVHQALKLQRIHEILAIIEKDGDTRKDYQPERDFIVRNIVKEIRHNKELIAEIDNELRKLLPLTGYKLHTMRGIDLATEAQLISEIGDINRFPDSDKLARFMGLAPVKFSSAGKGKDQRCRNGNRALNAIFHFMAVQMVAISPSGKPRHPVFREYFEQKVKEGKNKPQALVCVARRLVRIIYGMMKTKTEYRPYQKD